MRCPRCQHDNRPSAKFCEECAAALPRHCPGCGTRQHLAPAAAMYREMGMASWLELTERELAAGR